MDVKSNECCNMFGFGFQKWLGSFLFFFGSGVSREWIWLVELVGSFLLLFFLADEIQWLILVILFILSWMILFFLQCNC